MLKLKVKTWSADTHENNELDSQGSVAIVVTSDELSKHIFPTVIDLDIIAKDGSRARFFISAKVKNGRPVAELSVNRGTGSTRKSVTGTFNIKPKD